jgi:hypothetical protein
MTSNVRSWKDFSSEIRKRNVPLLSRLSEFPDPLLVTGCQRSGTTILTEVLLQTDGMDDYRRGRGFDSELDGALILCGNRPYTPKAKRYCFQTTYINQNIEEYFRHKGHFKTIFLLRNPFSVVYSMVYHWKARTSLRNLPLNELFEVLGLEHATEREKSRHRLFGNLGISRILKAALSYVGKTSQVYELAGKLGDDLLVIDYDDLVQHRAAVLPRIFDFANLRYQRQYADLIHTKSITRADQLASRQRQLIEKMCWDTYVNAKSAFAWKDAW